MAFDEILLRLVRVPASWTEFLHTNNEVPHLVVSSAAAAEDTPNRSLQHRTRQEVLLRRFVLLVGVFSSGCGIVPPDATQSIQEETNKIQKPSPSSSCPPNSHCSHLEPPFGRKKMKNRPHLRLNLPWPLNLSCNFPVLWRVSYQTLMHGCRRSNDRLSKQMFCGSLEFGSY